MHIDLFSLIQTIGSLGVLSIIFAESGLFFGFFLPGDSLLFVAGVLAGREMLPFALLLFTLPVAAILGDSVGYWFGKKIGPKIFSKKESRFFNPQHVDDAHKFFLKHGKKALVFARFIPIFRTFVPIVAGVAKMPYSDFLPFNILGGLLWTVSLFLLGYFLGNAIPNSPKYLYAIVMAILVISTIPVIIEYLKSKFKKNTQ
jgi:membrane-associated protein